MGSWTQIRKREERGRGAARLSEELMNTPDPPPFPEIKGALGQEDEPRRQRSEDLGLLPEAVLGTMLLSARTDGWVRAYPIPVKVWVCGRA